MLILDHTLNSYDHRTLFCVLKSKYILLEKIDFKKIYKLSFWPMVGRPIGRSQTEQNCSIGRLSCTRFLAKCFVCTSVDRSVDRLQELCSRFGHSRPIGRPLNPTVRNPTVGGQPVSRPTEGFSSDFF